METLKSFLRFRQVTKKKRQDTVSIVAPAYNNPGSLAVFLRSLAARCRKQKFELIVVDDASPAPGLQAVVAHAPNVRLIRLKKNLGPSGSRNAGARRARGDILLFADSDSIVISDIVRWASQTLRDPQYSAVIGAPDVRPAKPGWFSDFWALVKAECLPLGSEGGSFYPAIGAIRREVFWQLGGFHEKLRSLEDFEFSDRLKCAGHRVSFEPRMTLRFFYPPALRNLRQSFSRAGKWIIMRWGKVSFDRHTTTRRQAAGMVLGALIVPLCLAAGVGWASWFWCGVVAMTYLTVVWPFLDFCRHHKGWFYVPVAMGLHVLVALVVTAGAVRAVLWRLTRVGPMDELLAARDA